MNLAAFPLRFPGSGNRRWLADLLVIAALGAMLYGILNVAAEWRAPFRAETQIDLSFWKLPEYTLYSLARGWAAMLLSLVFAILYATWAYYDRRAQAVMLPMLDILQSIPVLGFMPGLVLALVAIFPHSNLGLELACVLMIFTAQVWNMVFSYYDSLRAIPDDLRQMGVIAGFSPVQRFFKLELPFAAQGLIYNCMVSMAGGWFFLTINEAFTLGNRNFQLPGVGSYMSVAIAQNNVPAQIAGVIAMGVMIIAVDRLIWWPLVIWSRKFKLEDTASGPAETTLIARWLAHSGIVGMVTRAPKMIGRAAAAWKLPPGLSSEPSEAPPTLSVWTRALYPMVMIAVLAIGGLGSFKLGGLLLQVSFSDWIEILSKALLTFGRVLAALIISSLWTIPVGVWIGLNPKIARPLQPLIQFAASFPAPMLYPIVFGAILALGGTLDWGAIILMMLGAQWYILFNVAAGAQSIPGDVNACAAVFQLRGWRKWRHFILPSIFPFLVTGWITSAGGAWNASIVSEYLQQGEKTFIADGLGAYISEATNAGHFPQLAAAVVIMAVFVVTINRSFWKRLQHKADKFCRFGG